MKYHTLSFKSIKQQQGAALLVTMVILLSMTIIAISNMKSTVMEEKITGNLRDKALSRQAASIAIREPESWLNNQPDPNKLPTRENAPCEKASDGCTDSVQIWLPGGLNWSDVSTVNGWWGDYTTIDANYDEIPVIYGSDGATSGTKNYCGDSSKAYKRVYGFNDGNDANNCIPQVVLPPAYVVETFPAEIVTSGNVKYDCSLKVDDYFYRITTRGYGARNTTSSTVRSYYLKKC